MDIALQRRRVQIAILAYLGVFVGFFVYVWAYFAIHRHGFHYFPLGDRIERFGDLVRFSGKFQYGKDPRIVDSEHLVGTLFPANYPPLAVVIYLFLLQVCAPFAVVVMLGTFFGTILVACGMLWRRVRRAEAYKAYVGFAIFATGFAGWGTLQVAMRGNIEGWMWIATCLGAWLFSRRRYLGAGAALGVAMCIKPYPVLWLALMARHRRWKEATLGLLTWGAVTLASLLMIDQNPMRAYHHISAKSNFFATYIAAFRPVEEMMLDHSLLQTMKAFVRVVRNHGLHYSLYEYGMHPNDPTALKLYHAYLPIAALIGLTVLWQVWNKPMLNQIFALSTITTLLPMVSGDYTLSVLLIPMGFLLITLMEDEAAGRKRLSLAQMLWILLPCACIMATVPLGMLHGMFKCAALLVLLSATSIIALPSTLFREIEVASDALQPSNRLPLLSARQS
ncbi:MAG: hypothetical protein NVSMB62_15700 [Acidobacteriaceae bacterium]